MEKGRPASGNLIIHITPNHGGSNGAQEGPHEGCAASLSVAYKQQIKATSFHFAKSFTSLTRKQDEGGKHLRFHGPLTILSGSDICVSIRMKN